MAIVAGVFVAAVGYFVAASENDRPALGPGVVTVEVDIRRSRFDLGELRVQEGTLVQFVVHNRDPIDHELVVGDAELHGRHRKGTEQRHTPAPGEVSVAAGDTATTYYEFNEPGTVTYTCHLPGHEAYGMTGQILVVPAS